MSSLSSSSSPSYLSSLSLLLLTAVVLSPGGSGYFACIQNKKLVTTKFKSGGLHEKQVVATWNLGNHVANPMELLDSFKGCCRAMRNPVIVQRNNPFCAMQCSTCCANIPP